MIEEKILLTNNMIYLHNHTDTSNFRLIDCTNKTERLIDTVVKKRGRGVAITDHEALSSHISALQYVKKRKEKNEIPKDFKLILGNEIYLVNSLEEVRDNYESGKTKFPHFILLAKDKIGHRQLRELSSKAWENGFYTGQMERTPTVKADLERIVKGGHIVGTTACLGGEFPQYVFRLLEAEKLYNEEPTERNKERIQNEKIKIHQFITWCIGVFGKNNFFIELQPNLILNEELKKHDKLEKQVEQLTNKIISIKPARNFDYENELEDLYKELRTQKTIIKHITEQMAFNVKALEIAKGYKLDWIIATDTHYLEKEDRAIHEAFLNSKEGDREVGGFYMTTYIMEIEEIYELLGCYISDIDISRGLLNTLKIGDMIEDYDLYHPVVVPEIELPEFEVGHLFKEHYDKVPYIKNFAYSKNEQDRYYLYLVEEGLKGKEPLALLKKEEYDEILFRINTELEELWLITEELNTHLSSYYITTREIINIMWNEGDSLVGVARGSVTGWYTAYLMDIVQMNPIKWNLPHWRHIHHSRSDLPDVDLDSQQSRRQQILQALKRYFGEMRVLNICTFGTEGSRSAILTACRGLDIDVDEAQVIANMIPSSRGQNWSLDDCLNGNEEEGKAPVKELISKLEEYDRLREVALGIEGLINKRSIHASGVYIFNDDYIEYNAMMKAPNGQPVTQFNMEDSDYMGGLKVDLLTIQALDKIRTTVDMLVEDGYMEWQGSLRETYNKYLHPDVLDYETEEMWDLLGNNEVIDLFQFDTDVGSTSAQAIKPKNLIEMATANSVMRLASEGTEQPIDTYVKYKNDIGLWYKEMKDYGLTEDEIKVLERYLLIVYGVADTQEIVMELAMDKDIANFNVTQANQLRKSIAKKKKDLMQEVKELFYEKGREAYTSLKLLHYVWDIQIFRQLG